MAAVKSKLKADWSPMPVSINLFFPSGTKKRLRCQRKVGLDIGASGSMLRSDLKPRAYKLKALAYQNSAQLLEYTPISAPNICLHHSWIDSVIVTSMTPLQRLYTATRLPTALRARVWPVKKLALNI